MIIGVVLFAVLGLGITGSRALKRQWLPAIGSLVGGCCVEMGYGAVAMHQPWIALAAAAIGVTGSAVLWILMRRSALGPQDSSPADSI